MFCGSVWGQCIGYDDRDPWIKDQEITPKAQAVEELLVIVGLPAAVRTYQATNPNGDTVIDFVKLFAGDDQPMLPTLWAPLEVRNDNKADSS